jgi:hypothetical protein
MNGSDRHNDTTQLQRGDETRITTGRALKWRENGTTDSHE